MVEEVGEKSDGRTQYKNLENSAEASNSQIVVQASRKHKKPTTTRKEDFFMVDDNQTIGIMVNCEKAKNITVLHHNIQSLNNKIQELSLYLHVSETMVNVLCFTEHWLSGDQIKLIILDQYKLRSQFCRDKKRGGGSCIFVKDVLRTKQIHYLSRMGQEKDI
jgi:hypothetical protein